MERFIIGIIAILATISSAFGQNVDRFHVTNSICGDAGYVSRYGIAPVDTTTEQCRIKAHLSYVEDKLRQKDVSGLTPELKKNRHQLLDYLHEYCLSGIFPSNYDYPGIRIPCFIDYTGKICAVGYLIERTAGRDVAEKISENHKYEFLLDMDDKAIDDWISSSGLTPEECAMIQPSYDYQLREYIADPCDGTTDDSISPGSSTLPFYPGDSGRLALEMPNFRLYVYRNSIKPEGLYTPAKVKVSFVVQKNGDITCLNVVGSTETVRNEALRLIMLSGKWSPATWNGKKVKYRTNFSIEFDPEMYNKRDADTTYQNSYVEPRLGSDKKANGREMQNYIKKTMKYPNVAKEVQVEGTVIVLATIDTNGRVVLATTLKGHTLLNDEAERIIRSLPPLHPAKRSGVVVSDMVRIAVRFKLPK